MEKYVLISYLLILSTLFFFTMSIATIAPLFPVFKREFGCNSFVYGLIVSSFSCSNFFSLLVCGRLSDKYGRRIVLFVSLCGLSGCSLWTGFSRSATIFIISRFAAGCFGGVILVCKAYIADITPPGDRSKYLALSTGIMGSGATLGPIIGCSLGKISIYAPFYFFSGACLTVFFLCLIFLKDSKTIKNQMLADHIDEKKDQKRIPLLPPIMEEKDDDFRQHDSNLSEKPDKTYKNESSSSHSNDNYEKISINHFATEPYIFARHSSLSSLLGTSDLIFTPQSEIVDEKIIPKSTDKITIIFICLSVFITWSSFTCFLSVFNLWITEVFQTSSMISGAIFTSANAVIACTAAFIYPFLFRYVFNSTILLIGSTIQCICWVTVVTVQKEIPCYIFAILAAIGNSLANTGPHILMSLCSSPESQGKNLSYSLGSDSLSRTIFPILYGIIYGYSMQLPFWICASCALINIPVGVYLKFRVKQRENDLYASTLNQKDRTKIELLQPIK